LEQLVAFLQSLHRIAEVLDIAVCIARPGDGTAGASLAVIFSNPPAYDLPVLHSVEADPQLFVDVGEFLYLVLELGTLMAVFVGGPVIPAKMWWRVDSVGIGFVALHI